MHVLQKFLLKFIFKNYLFGGAQTHNFYILYFSSEKF